MEHNGQAADFRRASNLATQMLGLAFGAEPGAVSLETSLAVADRIVNQSTNTRLISYLMLHCGLMVATRGQEAVRNVPDHVLNEAIRKNFTPVLTWDRKAYREFCDVVLGTPLVKPLSPHLCTLQDTLLYLVRDANRVAGVEFMRGLRGPASPVSPTGQTLLSLMDNLDRPWAQAVLYDCPVRLHSAIASGGPGVLLNAFSASAKAYATRCLEMMVDKNLCRGLVPSVVAGVVDEFRALRRVENEQLLNTILRMTQRHELANS